MSNEWKCERCDSSKKSFHRTICEACYYREWRNNHPDKVKERVAKYRKNNPEKKRIWDEAGKSIKIEGLCEMCKLALAQHRHHPDYDFPLKVILVCAKCHKRIHSPQNHPMPHPEDKGSDNGNINEDTSNSDVCKCGHEKYRHGCNYQNVSHKGNAIHCDCKEFEVKG